MRSCQKVLATYRIASQEVDRVTEVLDVVCQQRSRLGGEVGCLRASQEVGKLVHNVGRFSGAETSVGRGSNSKTSASAGVSGATTAR